MTAYTSGVVKPFCPCDTARPQDCQPEDWPGAHAEPPCLNCGRKRYEHHGWRLLCCTSATPQAQRCVTP